MSVDVCVSFDDVSTLEESAVVSVVFSVFAIFSLIVVSFSFLIHPSCSFDVFIFTQSFKISTTSTSSSFFTLSSSIELINGITLILTSSVILYFLFLTISSSFSALFVSVVLFSTILLSSVCTFSEVFSTVFSVVFCVSSFVCSFLFFVLAASLLSNSIRSFLIYPVTCLYFTLYHWSSSFNISTSSPCDANSNTLESVSAFYKYKLCSKYRKGFS